jgi:hypothetical protein
MITTTTTTFNTVNEYGFLDLLKANKFSERVMTSSPDSPLSELENHVNNIAKTLDSRRDHNVEDVKPFYRHCGFIWVYASTGEEPHERITAAALLRFPNDYDATGELIYFDTASSLDENLLPELREEALKQGKTWYEGFLTPKRLGLYRDITNLTLLDFLEEPVTK